MKLVSLFVVSGLLIPALGQTGVIATGNVTLKDFAFYWQTRLEPPSPPMANALGYGSGVNDKTGNIYRVMIDRATRTYFGYEVRVEPLTERNEYRMTFHPLDLSPRVLLSIHLDDPATWSKREIGAAAAPDTVHTLDVIAVNLLVNQETKQKIVDYVVLQEPNHSLWTFDMPIRREFAYDPGSPRDFRVEDASLRIVAPILSINGRIEETNSRDDFGGTTIWVYVQNRGRYLLSLVPQPGFRKAGEVRGTSLTFTPPVARPFAGGNPHPYADRFTIGSASRIAPGDAPFNLYVMEEPEWKPANANGSARVVFGAVDLK